MKMKWIVEVRTTIGGWTVHSRHATHQSAQEQADLVHGRVRVESSVAALRFVQIDAELWREIQAFRTYKKPE